MDQRQLIVLIFGDMTSIAILTLIGFGTHNEIGVAFLPRMITNFGALYLSWLATSLALRLFDGTIIKRPKELWRPLVAALFAGPLAAVIRGLALNTVVLPIFAIVLSATAGLGLLLWRGVLCSVMIRNK